MGIKKKDLSKLFKYFGKLNDTQKINTKGTGLGLMISRKIVQSMGGEINIESEVNNGTKFNISVNIQVKNPLY
jgi:signal transduction histidine kinase